VRDTQVESGLLQYTRQALGFIRSFNAQTAEQRTPQPRAQAGFRIQVLPESFFSQLFLIAQVPADRVEILSIEQLESLLLHRLERSLRADAIIDEQVQHIRCFTDVTGGFLPVLINLFLCHQLCLMLDLTNVMDEPLGNTLQTLLIARLQVAKQKQLLIDPRLAFKFGTIIINSHLPLDSLSEWTGKKAINVVSNVPDLDKDTEFLALLGRLSVKGFDVNFDHSEFSDEGLILEVLEVQDKIAISIKSFDSQRYLFSTLVDQVGHATSFTDTRTFPQRILPLPLDFKPKRVAALSMSAREDGRLVFLSDAKLVLGSLKANNIHIIDELQSNIKDSKAIYLSIGQADSDPNLEVAVVWGQDRDISGKGQYTKIYSQLFEISEKGLGEESERKEDVAIRFIDDELYAQRYELLNGDIGKLMAAALKSGKISVSE
jgi:hypothetical protein